MNPEIIDNINKPNHYIGTYGLEVKDVTRNFIKGKSEMEAHHWCSAVEYLLRYKEKNGIEDLKKARKNLDWLIEEMENERIRVVRRGHLYCHRYSCRNQQRNRNY